MNKKSNQSDLESGIQRYDFNFKISKSHFNTKITLKKRCILIYVVAVLEICVFSFINSRLNELLI